MKNHRAEKAGPNPGHVHCRLGQNPRPKGTESPSLRPRKMLNALPGGKSTGSRDAPPSDRPAVNGPEPFSGLPVTPTLSSLLDNEFWEVSTCWKQNSTSFHSTCKSSCSNVTHPSYSCGAGSVWTRVSLCPLGAYGALPRPLSILGFPDRSK